MSAIANLISLEGIKVLSTAGTPDRILFDVAVDDGQLQSIETGVAEGKKIVFDIYPDIQRMSFDSEGWHSVHLAWRSRPR